MPGREGPGGALLAELRAELRAGLERMEALHRQWGDPLDEGGALRRGLRAELAACLPGPGGCAARPPGPDLRAPPQAFDDGPAAGGRPGAAGPQDLSPPRGPWAPAEAGEPASGLFDGSLELSVAGSRPCSRSSCSSRMLAASVPQPPSFEKSSVGLVRGALWRLVHQYQYRFDMVMGLVIIANSISVGLEIQWDLQGRDSRTSVTRQLEHLFLAVFVAELIIRVLADGPMALRSTWFKFDALLVSIGVVSSWIVAPIMGQVNSDGNAFLDVISQLLILRILRLLRLVRALRLFEQFQEMWKLANGLVCSLRTVLSACILILMTVYMFACLGIELISRNTSLQEDPVTAELIQTHFRSLPMAMLTLCQFASADSIAIVYTPLVEKVWYLGFYFSAVWLVVTVCLMNLITAVIVDKAIAQGGMDREMEAHLLRKKMRAYAPCINAVFADMDKSGDGQLHLSEVKCGLEHIERRIPDLPQDLQRVFGSDQLIDLFEFLDTDGSGAIDEQEFLDGVSHLVLQSIPIETTQTLNLLRSQSKMLSMIADSARLRGDLSILSPGREGPAMPHLPISGGSRAAPPSAKPGHLCIRVEEPSDQAPPMDL